MADVDDQRRSGRAPWVERLVAETDGPVKVQVSAEVGVDFPVEMFDEHGPGFVRPGSLGLSQSLEDELTAWLRWWERHVDATGAEVVSGDEHEWRRWNQEGVRLVARVQAELGSQFHVRLG